jgi:hypothetical protein
VIAQGNRLNQEKRRGSALTLFVFRQLPWLNRQTVLASGGKASIHPEASPFGRRFSQ